MIARHRIVVNGIVQGVGFRPFVYNLATELGLFGTVLNSSSGVFIEVQGSAELLTIFSAKLVSDAPPLSEISNLDITEIVPTICEEFEIILSTDSPGTSTMIPFDSATCDDCLSEINDPSDRRFGYPFTNCTNCGPRYTIIKHIPYDRPFTSMDEFEMCEKCQSEYDDPGNRRFHAQPNACPECGPKVWIDGLECNDPVAKAAELLRAGKIGAIKGLGGFHLAVDAENQTAVAELRKRKNREAKPLAIMVRDLEAARKLAVITDSDEKLLTGAQRPIVRLPELDGPERVGLMLPYTPLHHLLLAKFDGPLIMTSGNLSDEPIATSNEDAKNRLSDIADFMLLHDRDIVTRCDDSVILATDSAPLFFRRSRGFVPKPVILDSTGPAVLACGGDLKNTPCLLKESNAFIGQHIGDMEHVAACDFFTETITHMQSVFESEPSCVAVDLHPGYHSSNLGRKSGKQVIEVQHHHAHMIATCAEHKINTPVIGLIMDGTGYGTDGTIWGGEILVGNASEFTRFDHIANFQLPGSDTAIKQPWRVAVSMLHRFCPDIEPDFPDKPVEQIKQMLSKNINSPETSSCGRFFDGIAALAGGRTDIRYEAQAAIEMMYAASMPAEPLPFDKLNLEPVIRAVVELRKAGASFSEISSRFHTTVIAMLVDAAKRASIDSGITDVVLGGGVFNNEILIGRLPAELAKAGLTAYRPVQLPPGDGGLSVGQAVIARAKLRG